MDLDLTPAPPISTHDTENDTPPHTIQSAALKNHHHRHHPPAAVVTTFKECMKNHAANIGGHAVDGCGEFMPSPSANPTSLKCAACGCHRNFHRREPDWPTAAITPPFLDFRHPPLIKRFSLSPSPPPPPPPPPSQVTYEPHMLFGISMAVGTEEHHQAPVTPTAEYPIGRKRFRTKFSQEQKEKMRSFSVKLGWKMQKCDETAVKEFCHEIGVTRGVLKVWMHNNKNTFAKQEIGSSGGDSNIITITNGGLIRFQNNGHGGGGIRKIEERLVDINGNNSKNESGNGVHFHGSNNGSSPSS